jgi:eukaryotic-like serine/threonine-protein kinase
MGSVLRAAHLTLRTPLAIERIESSSAESAEAVARFKREAHAAAELRSVYVVQIIDHGVYDGMPFIATELLDGESLAARLERVVRLSPAHTPGRALDDDW